LPIQARPGHRFGQFGREHGIPGHVQRLFADLLHAAEDHIVDQRRIGAGAVHERIDDLRREVGRVPILQTSAALPAGGASGRHDIGFSHGVSPYLIVYLVSCFA
jgi:hypothetical protein